MSTVKRREGLGFIKKRRVRVSTERIRKGWDLLNVRDERQVKVGIYYISTEKRDGRVGIY